MVLNNWLELFNLEAGGISIPDGLLGSALPPCLDRLLQKLPDQYGSRARRTDTWIIRSQMFGWDVEEALNSVVHGYLWMKLIAGERPAWCLVANLFIVKLLMSLSSNPWWPLQLSNCAPLDTAALWHTNRLSADKKMQWIVFWRNSLVYLKPQY